MTPKRLQLLLEKRFVPPSLHHHSRVSNSNNIMAPKRSQLHLERLSAVVLPSSIPFFLLILFLLSLSSSLLRVVIIVIFLLSVVFLFPPSLPSFLLPVVIFLLQVIILFSLLPPHPLRVAVISLLPLVIAVASVVLLDSSAVLCFGGDDQSVSGNLILDLNPNLAENQSRENEVYTDNPKDEDEVDTEKDGNEDEVVNRPTTLLDLPWDVVQQEIYGGLDFHSRVNFRNAFYFPPFMCSSLNSTDLLSLNVIASNEPWHLLHRVGSMKTNQTGQELIHEFYLVSENRSHILVERLLLSPKIQVSKWHASIELNNNLPHTINLAAASYNDEVQYQIVGSEWSQIVGSEWGEL